MSPPSTSSSPVTLVPAPSAEDRPWHWSIAFALTALAYLVVGFAAVSLVIPPGYASPLYPPAGIALVGVAVFGWRMAPAAALGAIAVNLAVALERGSGGVGAVAVALAAGIGAGAQAWVGAWLVQRRLAQPITLAEPRDVGTFLALGGPVACLVSTTLGHLALVATGTVALADLPLSWFTWWAGDTLGVLIGAPIAFTLVGRPRSEWLPRRLTVAVPLAVVTVIVSLGIVLAVRQDEERINGRFERDAAAAATAASVQLHEPLHALEALRGVFVASTDVTRAEMHRAAQAWLEPRHLLAVGWAEHVGRADVAAWEARVRNEGLPDFRVVDRAGAPTPTGDEAIVAIRYIEPLDANRGALGVNARSNAPARLAIDATAASGKPAATASMRLAHSGPTPSADGVVIYQAVYADPDAAPGGALRGVVFVTLRSDDLLAALRAGLPDYLGACLVDAGAAGGAQRLAGPPGCEALSEPLSFVHPLPFAGRQWQIHLSARPSDIPDARGGGVWLFALAGLLAAALLGALLLIVSGRTRRIEAAVRERTAALQAEMHERERAQAALRESERRFRNILATVPMGIVYTDVDGRVRQANPRFCELTGYAESELQVLPPAAYTHPEDAASDAPLTAQLLAGELPMVRREKRLIARDGRTLHVRATTTLLRDAKGRARRIVGVIEDISEHLRLEEAEHAREVAEAANRAKSDFLSRMSHELRTPLNAMLGFAQLLELDQRQPLAPGQRPWVSQIQQAGWHLLEMINDVLDLSRIESGNLRLQSDPVETAKVIADTIALVEADAARRGIRITSEVEPQARTLLGDTTRVKQVLTNLLSNAVKYNVDGGSIHVVARPRGEAATEIAVADTGLGLSRDQLDSLFQPFNRLGRERSAQPGTGIGLVISRRLAELMGGTIEVESGAGEGSVFRLTLPRAGEHDTVASELPALSASEPEYHQRVVHYVEDNETNVEVMRGVLGQRPQVRLEVSMTGLDGLARIRTSPPDMVLLDMHLPDIQGLELLRHLKADPTTADIPVVVLSADALTDQVAAALRAGAVRYLTKPVDVTELLEVIDRVLEGMETRYG